MEKLELNPAPPDGLRSSPPGQSDPSDRLTITLTKCIGAEDDEVDICIQSKRLTKFVKHSITQRDVIVAEGMLAIDAMHERFARRIGFNTEG